jgi:4-hydroxy-3-methylbut-2-enyl diphosphate reductase
VKIIKASVLGFCFGVRRAVTIIETELEENGPLCTLGAIVHNTHVVESLASKGARLVRRLDEVPTNGAVAITAHGAGEETYAEIKRRNLRLIDTTCPIVRRAQETAARLVKEGFFIILYGEAEHPEVKGILSWTAGQGMVTQTSTISVPTGVKGVAIIAQTTKNPQRFAGFAQQIAKEFTGKVPEIRIIDTTCPETGRRYQAARELAGQVDALIVVGSRSSANTRKLAETSRCTGIPTYHIESAAEIKPEWLMGKEYCGVTAGASTPDNVIEEVVKKLQEIDKIKTRKGGNGDEEHLLK